MTLKFSRALLAAVGLCAVVGAALAQQPASTSGQRRGAGQAERNDADPAAKQPPIMYYSPPNLFQQSTADGANWYRNFNGVGAVPASAEEMNLSQQATQLARKLSDAKSDSDRDKIKGDLHDLLEKQFQLRQGRHEKEIEALENQVKKLKDLVRKRNDNRREIISKRLDQIVSDAEGLGW
jgi:hypothetical protein